jgi:hypothetical protein
MSEFVSELLLLEADSSGTGTVWEPRGKGTSAVGSRYQATTGEVTAGWKRHSVCFFVEYELAIVV